jgi:hypothetical protein
MIFREVAKQILPKPLIKAYLRWAFKDYATFGFPGTADDIKKDIRNKYDHQGDLLDIYASARGGVVTKWHHYFPLYERYLSPFRSKPIRFLEIGVFKGGSLQMWRDYFGNQATIYGIDINPDCKRFDGLAGQVRIGSQIDAGFLDSVINEMGGVDIILDDGSHHMEHIPITLRHLFPRLSQGGIYMIEDLHTAYWQYYGGGYNSKSNFFGLTLDIVHDMHRWYHRRRSKHAAISHECTGIHIHDSFIVFDKNKTYRPVFSQMGAP